MQQPASQIYAPKFWAGPDEPPKPVPQHIGRTLMKTVLPRASQTSNRPHAKLPTQAMRAHINPHSILSKQLGKTREGMEMIAQSDSTFANAEGVRANCLQCFSLFPSGLWVGHCVSSSTVPKLHFQISVRSPWNCAQASVPSRSTARTCAPKMSHYQLLLPTKWAVWQRDPLEFACY